MVSPSPIFLGQAQLIEDSSANELLAQKLPDRPAQQPKAPPAFEYTGGWLGFTGRNGEALQVKFGKNANGRPAVQTASGKIYTVPTSLTGRAAVAQWLNKADSAGAISGAWANPSGANKTEAFKLNRAQIAVRERLSGTWNIDVKGVTAKPTYLTSAIEYDKLKGTLKVYVQPPAGELQLFKIDVGATVYNQRGALTSNGLSGITHDFFRLQKEHPILAMVAWGVMGTIGAAATKNPELARHVGLAAGSFAIAGQADEVRVSLIQTKGSLIAQSRLNIIDKSPGGELRTGGQAVLAGGIVDAGFNTPDLGVFGKYPFVQDGKAIFYTGGGFNGKGELQFKMTTQDGLKKVVPEAKFVESAQVRIGEKTGWNTVIGANGRALNLSSTQGRAAATKQFSDLNELKLRLQALDPDRKEERYSLVTGVVPRLEVNKGKAGQGTDPTIYQDRSLVQNFISNIVRGSDSFRRGINVTEEWQKNWNNFNRSFGAPFTNHLVPLNVLAGHLKAVGTKYPETYGELAYVNEKRLLEANGERLYWVQTGRDGAGKPIRVPCLREGDVFNTSLVTIEGKSGLHLASAQMKKDSKVATKLPAAAATQEWEGPSPTDNAQRSARGFAAYREAESYLSRLRAYQSKPGLSEKLLTRIDGQIQTLMQRLAQGRTNLVKSSNGLIKLNGDRLVPSSRLTDYINSQPPALTKQDAHRQYLTTL